MSKEMSIILLGVWVVVVPYLGVPSSWRTVLLVVSGVTILVLGLLLRGESIVRGTRKHRGAPPFVENSPEMSEVQ
jgi:VIT1/CCC1 family predicted Fe2+/Mn2+ transporter